MTKYRPPDWKNPYKLAIAYQPNPQSPNLILRLPDGQVIENSYANAIGDEAYEAGADAMLEELRKLGYHVDGDASFSSLGEHTTLSNSKNTGNYLFIPDDIPDKEKP